MRFPIVALITGLVIAGCGGGSSASKTSTTATTTTVDNSARAATCAHVNEAMAPIGADAGALGKNFHDPAALARMATDAATLNSYLSALLPFITDPGQQATLKQYMGILTQLEAAMQSTSTADSAVATGQLQGIVQQNALLLPKMTAICP